MCVLAVTLIVTGTITGEVIGGGWGVLSGTDVWRNWRYSWDTYIHSLFKSLAWNTTFHNITPILLILIPNTFNISHNHFMNSGDGSSPHPCSYTYSGPMAASESEVRHLQNYIMGNKNDIKSVVTVHSYSQLILYPYNYAANPCPDDEILV